MVNNYKQDIFYFNNIERNIVKDSYTINMLKYCEWIEKKIILKKEIYNLNFLYLDDKNIYLKTLYDHNTKQFNNLFDFNLLNWFKKEKIIKLIEYN
tara:strand:- start:11241 stop:11528 length:288 start_codon:yes stop_codon:yes gene_type:complete